MLFSFLNPPKGKVLRKRSPNIQTDAPSRRPTKKSKRESLAPEITVTATPGDGQIPAPKSTVRPQVTRSTSLRKRNSNARAQAPARAVTDPVQVGKSEGGGKPARRKSIIKTILERRRERVEAGNKAYGWGGVNGNGNGERVYDPRLGVENLPLAEWSGLHIASPVARIFGGGEVRHDEEQGIERGGGGAPIRGEEKEKRRVDGGGGLEVRRGGYWGDYGRPRGASHGNAGGSGERGEGGGGSGAEEKDKLFDPSEGPGM